MLDYLLLLLTVLLAFVWYLYWREYVRMKRLLRKKMWLENRMCQGGHMGMLTICRGQRNIVPERVK